MNSTVRIADEVWIATAVLHQRSPTQEDFSVKEILSEVKKLNVTGNPMRSGISTHIYQHCVANREPSPARYRMLFETSTGRRRLYRVGDAFHPQRGGSKITPSIENLPASYREMIDWYHNEYSEDTASAEDPILALRGLGKELWADESADEYVQRLREDWK